MIKKQKFVLGLLIAANIIKKLDALISYISWIVLALLISGTRKKRINKLDIKIPEKGETDWMLRKFKRFLSFQPRRKI
jgi:hypothetical protein